METVRQSSKGEALRSQCSRELQRLFSRLEEQIMITTELYDEIRQQAIKEHLDDFSLSLIVKDILKPMNLSMKRKQEIQRQFSPIDTDKRPKGLPEPRTPVLIDEIVELKLPFDIFDPDGDQENGKEALIDIIKNSTECVWVKLRKNKQEIFEVMGDDFAGI